MGVEMASRDLCVARLDGLEQGVVDEDILVLGLYHVVALGSQARHMAVDVDSSLVFDALQHRVDHDERTGPADTGTAHHTTSNTLSSDVAMKFFRVEQIQKVFPTPFSFFPFLYPPSPPPPLFSPPLLSLLLPSHSLSSSLPLSLPSFPLKARFLKSS